MGKKKTPAAPLLTPLRAGRLYKLLTLLGEKAQTRPTLLRRLKLDIRGFYRDLEVLRDLGISVEMELSNRYVLGGRLSDALSKLPFPDPGLNVHDAQLLADGTTPAHRKLRQRINLFLHGAKPPKPNKPR